MPLPNRLCTTLPGERRIISALLQHFLHDSPCQIPFQGCVGWVSSMCSIISQEKTALHNQACENLLNIILLFKKKKAILNRTAAGGQENKWLMTVSSNFESLGHGAFCKNCPSWLAAKFQLLPNMDITVSQRLDYKEICHNEASLKTVVPVFSDLIPCKAPQGRKKKWATISHKKSFLGFNMYAIKEIY